MRRTYNARLHRIKDNHKLVKRYWQHEDTGTICISTMKPSSRWYQIKKSQYEQYMKSQVDAKPIA